MPNTTFNITNIAPNLKEMTMVVFYQFSNGETHPIKFPATTSTIEILTWGQDKCVWFDERDAEMERVKEELINNPIEVWQS